MERMKLEEFKARLMERKLVRENQIPYMLWWVKHYLLLHRLDDPEYSQILQEESKEDWQIILQGNMIYFSLTDHFKGIWRGSGIWTKLQMEH